MLSIRSYNSRHRISLDCIKDLVMPSSDYKGLDAIFGCTVDDIFGSDLFDASLESSLEPSSPELSDQFRDGCSTSSSKCNSSHLSWFSDQTNRRTAMPWSPTTSQQSERSRTVIDSQEEIAKLRRPPRSYSKKHQFSSVDDCQKFSEEVNESYSQPPPIFEPIPQVDNLRSCICSTISRERKTLSFRRNIDRIRLIPILSDEECNVEEDSLEIYGSHSNHAIPSQEKKEKKEREVIDSPGPMDYIDIRKRDRHLISDIMDPNHHTRVKRRAKSIIHRRERLKKLGLEKEMYYAKTDRDYKIAKYKFNLLEH